MTRTCSYPDCDREARALGLCQAHRLQQRLGQDLRPIRAKGGIARTCSYPGCERPHNSRGLCAGHVQQRRAGKDLRPLRGKATRARPVRTHSAADRKRAREMWGLYADDGLTYEEIAVQYGLTRERARQILVAHYGKGLMGLVRRRRVARARHRDYLDTNWTTCFVCGAVYRRMVPQGKVWTACPEHSPYAPALRLIVDPVRHEKHRKIMAVHHPAERSWREAHPGRRVFRWAIPGSANHAILTAAYANGWPIVDRLPATIVEQLAAEAEVA